MQPDLMINTKEAELECIGDHVKAVNSSAYSTTPQLNYGIFYNNSPDIGLRKERMDGCYLLSLFLLFSTFKVILLYILLYLKQTIKHFIYSRLKKLKER